MALAETQKTAAAPKNLYVPSWNAKEDSSLILYYALANLMYAISAHQV